MSTGEGQAESVQAVDAVCSGEVERIECLHLRKACLAEPLADHRLVPRRLLGGEDLMEIILMGPMRIACLTSEGLKGTRDPW